MMRPRSFISGLMLLLSANLALADEKPVQEYAMKTAYLYNFAQLAEWPSALEETGDSTFNLCVYGTDDWGSALELLRGKAVNGRRLQVRKIEQPAELRQCHVLFVGEGDGRRGERLLDGARGLPILTVTDSGRTRDAMLSINAEKQRLVFEANLDIARNARIRLSSKLLRLAGRVVGQ